uniref:Retrotransposon gag domain-containing protein n=1 Tax=Cannabis sativa TaxID=3483 RepID=A0A803QQD3_CANSA
MVSEWEAFPQDHALLFLSCCVFFSDKGGVLYRSSPFPGFFGFLEVFFSSSVQHCQMMISMSILKFNPQIHKAMQLSISVKNKLRFLDNSIPKPSPTDYILYKAWVKNNNIVISWILNSISKEIFSSILYDDSAAEIWTDLKEAQTVRMYFTKLKMVLEELSNYRPSSLHVPTMDVLVVESTPRTSSHEVYNFFSHGTLKPLHSGSKQHFDGSSTLNQ